MLDLPRLSVDIDLNCVGAVDREMMLAERPRVEQALTQVFGRAGLTVKRSPTEHAGGKWRLAYTTALGRPGAIEVDVNFLLRTPLWPVRPRDSRPIGGLVARGIPVLDEHELAAGKLAALLARSASRDLFDARALLRTGTLDPRRLRLGFVVYGGINREDWRSVSVDQVTTTAADVDQQLAPMLRADVRPPRSGIEAWTTELIGDVRALLSAVLPLTPTELAFLERLNQHGDIATELLTDDATERDVLRAHPGLLWKAQNVREQPARG